MERENSGPPELHGFFASLQAYHHEHLARLRGEGDEHLHRFGAAILEQSEALATAFNKRGISFGTDVAPLFVRAYYDFITIMNVKAVNALLRQEFERRRKHYRKAVHRLTEDAAPFSPRIKSEIKATWAEIERTNITQLSEEVSWSQWGAQFDQIQPAAKKESRKHAPWAELEKKLFSLFTEKGVSERQAYTLIGSLWAIIPAEFSAKFKLDAIRLRVKRRPPVKKGA